MSTIEELNTAGRVVRVRGNLRSHQQPTRRLYVTAECIEWMKNVLTAASSDGFVDGAATPKEQVYSLVNKFISGDDFDKPFPHPMFPEVDGVYRFRTADVRLDGWFPEPCCFVVAAMELKENCATVKGRDNEMRDQVIRIREELQINDGAYLTGDYNDHL